MAHAQNQITIGNLMQLTINGDGSVTIQLADKSVEVERHMPEGQLIFRRPNDANWEPPVARIDGPAVPLTKIMTPSVPAAKNVTDSE